MIMHQTELIFCCNRESPIGFTRYRHIAGARVFGGIDCVARELGTAQEVKEVGGKGEG
jgi:hypothetical protein